VIWRDASTGGGCGAPRGDYREPLGRERAGAWMAAASGRLGYAMLPLLPAASALGFTLALLVTFIGIGVLVSVLIIYAVAQVLAERKQNREGHLGS
jgi:hypothetical protein